MNLTINKLKKDNLISGTDSVKYYLSSCQANIDNLSNIDKNTKDFLVINKILKNPSKFRKYLTDGAEIFYGLFENKKM